MPMRLLSDSLGIRATTSISVAVALLAPFFVCARTFAGSSETGNRPLNRALILGGGGPAGEAWESGVIVALAEKGIDLSRADLILGTSAGAIVGARLASRMPASDFINAALVPADAPPPGQPVPMSAGPPLDLSFLATKLKEMGTAKVSQQSIRAEIGQWAQKVHPVISEAQFVASYQQRFPKTHWPGPAYGCVAVDAADGAVRVWNASSNVPLALAIASSCALPGIFAPVTINGHRFMDGGVRSVTNADLARGCKKAIVLAPTMGMADPIAKSFTQYLIGELEILRASGCQVELIAPDAASLKAFGASIGDERHRAPPLEAGRVEGRDKAGEVATIWND
jgi:NTE family protein